MPIFTIPLLKDDVWDKEDINTTIDVGRGQLMMNDDITSPHQKSDHTIWAVIILDMIGLI